MHKVVFYGLSTCGWCRRTKQFLDANGVQYELNYVDMAKGPDKQQAIDEVRRWNPRLSFPTVIVDNITAVIGFNEDELRAALDL